MAILGAILSVIGVCVLLWNLFSKRETSPTGAYNRGDLWITIPSVVLGLFVTQTDVGHWAYKAILGWLGDFTLAIAFGIFLIIFFMNRKESAERETTLMDVLLVLSALFLGMVIGGTSIGDVVKEAHTRGGKYATEWYEAIKKEYAEYQKRQEAEEARLKEEAKKKETEDAKDWKELTDAVTFTADRKLLKLPPLPEGVQWGVALKGVDPPVLIHPFYQKPGLDITIKSDRSAELRSEKPMEDVKVFRIQNGKALGFAFTPK